MEIKLTSAGYKLMNQSANVRSKDLIKEKQDMLERSRRWGWDTANGRKAPSAKAEKTKVAPIATNNEKVAATAGGFDTKV